MQTNVITSKQFTLNLRDISRGFILAVISSVMPLLETAYNVWIQGQPFVMDWKYLGGVALKAGIAYLVLNFFNQSKVITTAPTSEITTVASEIKKAV